MVPIIIVCYNNYKYVRNMINRLKEINEDLISNIHILNNASTMEDTKKYLETVDVKIIENTGNNGPWLASHDNKHIYNKLPNKFILTDADLELNQNMPKNFIETMVELSDKYNCYKIGLALDISEKEKFVDENKYDWEIQFWNNRIDNNEYELYNAEIDTTFCMIDKSREYGFNMVRIAGNYTAKHLPWYNENPIYNIYENYKLNENVSNKISTIKNKLVNYIETNYLKIKKNNEIIFIKNDENDKNINFWRDIFVNWEQNTFKIFDRYLKSNKIFIDIGGWIGTTCIYGSRKSKKVYVVEADKESYNDMIKNSFVNNDNIIGINKAIYNKDGVDIMFGKNKNLENSRMNDSTSQIYNEDDNVENCYKIKTITIESIINEYKIDPNNISLIKVDIEGGEEYILEDLYNIYTKYKIPMYISFHYTWWKNKDLGRFKLITKEQRNLIINYPFESILYE
jgi:FkbM family methyltransferase